MHFYIITNSVNEWAQLDGRLLVVFDGHCGLCNRAVRWFLRRDKQDHMRFAPSDTPLVFALLVECGVVVAASTDGPGSIVVVGGLDTDRPRALLHSNAVIAMLRVLPQPWPFWAGALQVIPRPMRDWGYGVIARWRYRIWGRLETCPLPTAEERARFL